MEKCVYVWGWSMSADSWSCFKYKMCPGQERQEMEGKKEVEIL